MSIPTMIDARPLVAAGLPLGPLTTPVVMYRTSGGRAYHVDHVCDALASRILRSEIQRHTVDLATSTVQVCNRCNGRPPAIRAAIEWSERGGKIASAVTGLATLVTDPPSPQRSVALQQLLTLCRSDRGADALGEHARSVGRDIDRALHTEEIAPEMYLTLAALMLSSTDPSTLSTTVLASTREHSPVLLEAFAHLAGRVIAGESCASACTQAASFLSEHLPAAPTLLAHIPALTRFSGADFASPVEWANAEWSAQRAADLTDITCHWQSAVESLAAEMGSTPNEVGYGYTGTSSTLTALAVATFPTMQITSEGSWLMVAPPALLKVCGLTTVAPAPPSEIRSVLAMAAVLFDDFYDAALDDSDDDAARHANDEVVRAAKAIEAAVALHI